MSKWAPRLLIAYVVIALGSAFVMDEINPKGWVNWAAPLGLLFVGVGGYVWTAFKLVSEVRAGKDDVK